jgi:hypothetical protein
MFAWRGHGGVLGRVRRRLAERPVIIKAGSPAPPKLHKPAGRGHEARRVPARPAAAAPRPRRTRWSDARRCTNARPMRHQGFRTRGPGQHPVGEGQPDLGAEPLQHARRIAADIGAVDDGAGKHLEEGLLLGEADFLVAHMLMLGGIARQHPRGVPDQVRMHAALGPIQRKGRQHVVRHVLHVEMRVFLRAGARRRPPPRGPGRCHGRPSRLSAMGCALPEAARKAA